MVSYFGMEDTSVIGPTVVLGLYYKIDEGVEF